MARRIGTQVQIRAFPTMTGRFRGFLVARNNKVRWQDKTTYPDEDGAAQSARRAARRGGFDVIPVAPRPSGWSHRSDHERTSDAEDAE